MEIEMYNNFLRDLNDLDTFKFNFPDCFQDCVQNKNPFNLNHKDFMQKYRFTKENIRRIIDLIRDDLENPEKDAVMHENQVPLEIQFLIALQFWGSGHPLLTSFENGISLRTLAKICKRVSAALSSNHRLLRMPATLSEKEAATYSFQALPGNGSKLPNVIGAVNHHVLRFRRQIDKHGSTSCSNKSEALDEQIQIQIVSDAFCKIRDIDCKPRSSSDAIDLNEMFVQSRIKERLEQNEFRGRILLAGENLRCTSYLFTPLLSPKNRAEESYNQVHQATLAPAKQCLSLWKKRFPILDGEFFSTFHTAKNTISSLAVLHNLAIDWSDPSLEFITENEISTCDDRISVSSDNHARTEFIKSNFN